MIILRPATFRLYAIPQSLLSDWWTQLQLTTTVLSIGTSYPLVPHPDTTELDTTTVQVIVKDETDLKNQQRQIINLSVSYTVYDLHYLIGQKVKYKIGTFTLVWDKQVCVVFMYLFCLCL